MDKTPVVRWWDEAIRDWPPGRTVSMHNSHAQGGPKEGLQSFG